MSRSGYYDWLTRTSREPRGRAAENQFLLAEIQQIHLARGYYGAPRIHRELLAREHHVGRHRVARLMRANGIRARRGKIKARPRSAPPVRRPDIVDHVRRDFHADTANALWFTDLTQIRTHQGWLYAAVVLDAFNREVISWTTADLETPTTAIRALRQALRSRHPPEGCIIHSDRGYQFTSTDWLDLAVDHHLRVSIGERKAAVDNAVMESWFASFKNEEIYPKGQPATRAEARARLFSYVWTYNHHRRHSTLGYVSPIIYATDSSICP